MKTLLERAILAESLTDINIIDMHGHLGRICFTIPDIKPSAMIEEMDRIGVRSIVCSSMQCFGTCPERGNAFIYEAMQQFPGRILGYVSTVPGSAEETRRVIEKWLAKGFVGIKLHNSCGIEYDDPVFTPAYEIAQERRLPILFHTWGAVKEFAQIRSIASKYPDAILLMAHAGSENEAEYIRIAKEFPNVFLELALSRSHRGLVRRFVEKVGAEKIVWGSDCYFLSQAQQIGKVVGADITDNDKIKILSKNAQRILNMKK